MSRENSPMNVRRARRPLASAVILAVMLPLLGSAGAYAHGIVGNRIFLSPIVGNDAFRDNALDLTIRRSNYEFSLLPAFEKQARRGEDFPEELEKRTARIGAALLLALSLYVIASAAWALWRGEGQEFSLPGLVLAVLAMPIIVNGCSTSRRPQAQLHGTWRR